MSVILWGEGEGEGDEERGEDQCALICLTVPDGIRFSFLFKTISSDILRLSISILLEFK